MPTVSEVHGRVTSEGRLEIQDHIRVSEGAVKVRIEPLESRGMLWIDEADWETRRARLLNLAGTVSDEDAREVLEIIEKEFGQVNPDDWS